MYAPASVKSVHILRLTFVYTCTGSAAVSIPEHVQGALGIVENACALEGIRNFVCQIGGAQLIGSTMASRKGQETDMQI